MSELEIDQADPQTLEELLFHENSGVQSDAACALGDLIRTKEFSNLSPSCVEALAGLLEHPSFLVQLEAAISLSEIRDHRGTPILLAASKRKMFRLDAIRALGSMQDPAAVEELRYWMKKRFAPWADKLQAAAALCKMGDASGQTYLTQKLRSNKAAERAATIHFMAECHHPNALEHLKQILTNPADTMRDVAARSLGLLGNPRAKPLLEEALLKEAPQSLIDDVNEAIESLSPSQG